MDGFTVGSCATDYRRLHAVVLWRALTDRVGVLRFCVNDCDCR